MAVDEDAIKSATLHIGVMIARWGFPEDKAMKDAEAIIGITIKQPILSDAVKEISEYAEDKWNSAVLAYIFGVLVGYKQMKKDLSKNPPDGFFVAE